MSSFTQPISRLLRPAVRILCLIGLSLSVSGGTRADALEVTYYDVAGTEAHELRKALNQSGPWNNKESRRFDARTDWNVVWSYRYEWDQKGCRLTTYEVKLKVEMILPRWKYRDRGSTELVQQWDRYSAALLEHEEGHRQNGIGVRDTIEREFEKLGTFRNCKKLEKEITRFTNKKLKEFQMRDVEFDRETNHGMRQGARFP